MQQHLFGEEIDNSNPALPKEIKHFMKKEKVQKIVLHDKTERLS